MLPIHDWQDQDPWIVHEVRRERTIEVDATGFVEPILKALINRPDFFAWFGSNPVSDANIEL